MNLFRKGIIVAALLAAGCKGSGGGVPLPNLTPESHSTKYFPITDGPHAVECASCHTSPDTYAQFDCTSCHGHEPNSTNMLHTTTPKYDYASSACYSCHPQGAKVAFDHLNITSSCATCHDVGAPFAALPKPGFTHQDMAAQDCSSCHFSFTDWKTNGTPPGLSFDPGRDITVITQIPTYIGTSITSVSPDNQVLHMQMNHASTQIDPAAFSACDNCHQSASAGQYYPGDLHSSLANLKLPQPTVCSDCHNSSVAIPTGFIGPNATDPAARNPLTGEMKHNAVLWANGAPVATGVFPQECGKCHSAPSQTGASWSTDLSGTTPTMFHQNLRAIAQPSSCVDCHANTRPPTTSHPAVLTGGSMPAGASFDHTVTAALADCNSCHLNSAATQFKTWSGAKFHAAGSKTPATCVPCHDGRRPTSTTGAGWASTTFKNSPFDYGTNALGVTHGDGKDCVGCHNGPGTGVWGSTMNWVGGTFDHATTGVAGTTCIACHTTQRPDLVLGAAAEMAQINFSHATNGSGDCFGCHQDTVNKKTFVNYFNATSKTLPMGDWYQGATYPGSTLAASSDQFIQITEYTLHNGGPYNLVTSMTGSAATLWNGMLHTSVALPAALNAGPSNMPDSTKCWHCHTNTNGTVTAYANGQYHTALTKYAATPGGAVVPFPQPMTQCLDCHAQMRPTGIVEKGGSDLAPMDHNATFKDGTSVTTMECATCHGSPGVTWADGLFHAKIGAKVPTDCTTCHYPMEADGTKSDLSSGISYPISYAMKHASAQMPIQNCQNCHTGALAKGATTPAASALWNGGSFHATVGTQPTACNDCHTGAEPLPNASTQSSVVYTMPLGQTATNGGQWANHGASDVKGKDCYDCHGKEATAATTISTPWSKAASFHAVITKPVACQGCHGTANTAGVGVIGTNNNLPLGLTNSTMLTSAGADATTGVAATTLDQITHADGTVSGRDCGFCHTQAGVSTTTGIKGKEWAQAAFHTKFSAANPLTINGTTARCSNCHMNVVPAKSFPGYDHSALTNASGSQDCSSCHSWPGTGTSSTPNWLGAAGGVPTYISVGGFNVTQPPAATTTQEPNITGLPHPTVGATPCTSCHTSNSGGKNAIGYDHASLLENSHCAACHEAGSNLVGTVWPGSTTETTGPGDTRPYTLATCSASEGGTGGPNTGTQENYAYHFYPVDCYQCHNAPTGISKSTTGTAYIGAKTAAWWFPHTKSRMTNPSTCIMCHKNGVPN